MTTKSSENKYFEIGIFVLIGITIIIIGLLVFGSGKLFQRTVIVETYFNESVQGISVGTPVKYRGMQIGNVNKIAFTSEIYKETKANGQASMGSRYIYVGMTITSPFFTQLTDAELNALIVREVKEGLRIKLTPQGLTGITYLELNFVDPKTSPTLAVDWTPQHLYIPSSASLITEFTENVQEFFNALKGVDFKNLFQDIDALAVSAKNVFNNVDDVIKRTDFDNLVNNVNKLTISARNTFENSNKVIDSGNHFIGEIENPTLTALYNLKIMADNLKAVSEQLKLSPSNSIFSAAPPPLDPKKL